LIVIVNERKLNNACARNFFLWITAPRLWRHYVCFCCDVICHIKWLGKLTHGSQDTCYKSELKDTQHSSHVVLSGPKMPPSLTHKDCCARVCLICESKRQTVRPISRPLQLLIDQLYLSGFGHTHLIKIMFKGSICARWCVWSACVHLMWQLEQWPGYRPCYKNVYPVGLIYFLRTHISLVFCILTINHISCSVCVMYQLLLD
jgi:hypothetical protein